MGAGPVKYRDTGRNGFRNVPSSVEAGKENELTYSSPLMSPGEKAHEDYLGV